MQFQKLTRQQKSIRNWRMRRNHLVCKLLDDNPWMSRAEALRQANEKSRGKRRGKKGKRKKS